MAESDPTLHVRFWKKVARRGPEDCWLWLEGTVSSGYGAFTSGGRQIGAHRMSWILTNGTIPAGAMVLHKCDNPPCVNPAHLFLGDALANSRDKYAKGRAKPCYGEQNGTRLHPEKILRGEAKVEAKLTEVDVRDIRRRVDQGFTHDYIGRKYGVSASLVRLIGKRLRWKHVK